MSAYAYDQETTKLPRQSFVKSYGAGSPGHLPEDEESDFPTQSATISRLQQVTSMRRPQSNETFNTLEIAHKLKLRNGNSISHNDGSPVQSIESAGDNNITDILSLSIKDKEIYKVIDRCVNHIINKWNPSKLSDDE